ncbi:MAG: TolC family protein [Pyrinomonadaceae bacterium]
MFKSNAGKPNFYSPLPQIIFSILFVIFLTVVSISAQTTPPTTQPPAPSATPPSNQPTAPPTQQQTEIQQNNNNQTQRNNQPNQTTNPTGTTNPAQQQQLPGLPTQTAPGVTPGGTIANPNPVIPQTPTQNVGTSGIAPATLPVEPPPIAPNYEAPIRPLPSAERVGVDITNQMPLTLDEAITLALQNSNDIDISRNDVQIAEFNLRAARGIYDPNFVNQSYYESATTPTASTIGGATNGSVTQKRFFGTSGVSGYTPFAGGSYSSNFDSSRLTTSNSNATLNPQFPATLSFSYVQPLFRGRRFDNNRRQIEIAKKNLSLTDAQFRQKAIETIAQVEQAYWDLTYALRNLQVQIDAVKQARTQLESNERLVSKGVLAPVEIIAANTQITTFEQSVYTAQEAVTKAENTLKTLMLSDRTAAEWSRPITPISEISLEAPKIPLETAVSDALKNRAEIKQLESNAEINRIDERFYRNQTKPQIDLIATYTSQGLAGTARPRTSNSTSALTDRVNQLSALANLPPLIATTTTTIIPPNLVGGYFNSLGNLIGQDFPTYRVGVQISLPLGNRVAKANLGRTLVQADRIKNQRAQQEQIIEAEVRNSLQAMRSAEARLASALASRQSAEQLYESEQRQFRAGTTTVFLVLQRQNELVAARGRELQAQTDLNKSISDFQRATGTTLSANSVEITKDSNIPDFIFRRPTDFGLKSFRAKKTEE